MNTAQKGKRIERELQKLVESWGFITHKATSNKWNRNDLWGCFDIMAKKTTDPDYTLYFQASTKWKCGVDLDEIEAFPQGSLDLLFMARRQRAKPFQFKMKYGNGDWREVSVDQIQKFIS